MSLIYFHPLSFLLQTLPFLPQLDGEGYWGMADDPSISEVVSALEGESLRFVVWDGADLAAGVYLVRIFAGDYRQI